jgi:phosphoenolpyruvate-protein kinase (PTS system EI component)
MGGVHEQGIPYVPGRARGRLCRVAEQVRADEVLLQSHEELRPLPRHPAGLIVVAGAPLSHPMIRLLGQGVPTVIATREQASRLVTGSEILIDGWSGLISDDPDALGSAEPEPEVPALGAPVRTLDGQAVELQASVSDFAGARRALEFGAAAIGLVRSEYLAPGGGVCPDASFFYRALGEICRAVSPLAVSVRLIDLAPDKLPDWAGPIPCHGALGRRGPRLYDIEPVRGVYRAEVEALGRLARDFPVSIVLPGVVHREEFLRRRREVQAWLERPLSIGAMAESPAGVLALGDLAQDADFVPIGCNDLMQCMFAADRDVPEVAPCIDPYAPALYRLLRLAAEYLGARPQRARLCGLLPRATGVLPVLLGIGYRTFSVEPVLIPHLAQVVRNSDVRQAGKLAAEVCAAADATAVRRLLGVGSGQGWGFGGISSPPESL